MSNKLEALKCENQLLSADIEFRKASRYKVGLDISLVKDDIEVGTYGKLFTYFIILKEVSSQVFLPQFLFL